MVIFLIRIKQYTFSYVFCITFIHVLDVHKKKIHLGLHN